MLNKDCRWERGNDVGKGGEGRGGEGRVGWTLTCEV